MTQRRRASRHLMCDYNFLEMRVGGKKKENKKVQRSEDQKKKKK